MHIVLPGALPPGAYAAALAAELPAHAPHLTALLAQARPTITPFDPALAGCTAFEASQLQRLGYSPDDDLRFGAGLGPMHAAHALGMRLADFARSEASEPVWLGAFAHVALGTDRASLLPADSLDVSADETHALVTALEPLWPDSGFHGHALAAGLLRVTVPPGFEPATASPLAVAGQSLQNWWQTDTSSRPWRRLLNEIQMVWHDHPVNRARQENGKPPVNALWLYGGAPAWTPAAAPEVQQDDSLLRSAQHGDWHGWLEAVEQLDRRLIAPLVTSREQPQGSLTLTLMGERRIARLDITPRAAWLRWLPPSRIDWKHWWSLPV